MSTTFGIIIKNGKLLNLPIEEDILEEDILNESSYFQEENSVVVIEVAYRSSAGIIWRNHLAQFLPVDTRVYPLDNTPQGIYTIGDIIKDRVN